MPALPGYAIGTSTTQGVDARDAVRGGLTFALAQKASGHMAGFSSPDTKTWTQAGADSSFVSGGNWMSFESGNSLYHAYVNMGSNVLTVTRYDTSSPGFTVSSSLSASGDVKTFSQVVCTIEVSDTVKLLLFTAIRVSQGGTQVWTFAVEWSAGTFGAPFLINGSVNAAFGDTFHASQNTSYSFDGVATVTALFFSIVSGGAGLYIWSQVFNVNGTLGAFTVVNNGATTPNAYTQCSRGNGQLASSRYMGVILAAGTFGVVDSLTFAATGNLDTGDASGVGFLVYCGVQGSNLVAFYVDNAGVLRNGTVPLGSYTSAGAWTWQSYIIDIAAIDPGSALNTGFMISLSPLQILGFGIGASNAVVMLSLGAVAVLAGLSPGGAGAGRFKCCTGGAQSQWAKQAELVRRRKNLESAWPYEHIFPPGTSTEVNQLSTAVSGTVGTLVPVLSYTVPLGLRFFLLAILQDFAGAAFNPGDALWTVDRNAFGGSLQGSYVQGLIQVAVPLGSFVHGKRWLFPRAYEFGPNEVVRSTVTNVNLGVGAPNTFVSGFFGYLVPDTVRRII